MPTRQKTREQRDELRQTLLSDCRSGALKSGDALPPMRELARRHGLSTATTQRVLQALAHEGILQLRQGAGAFVGRLPEHSQHAFAAVFGGEFSKSPLQNAVRDGFEAEIARRGASVLTLTPKTRGLKTVLARVANGALPVGGVFFFSSSRPAADEAGLTLAEKLGGARVEYAHGAFIAASPQSDTVRFDDEDGVRQAVRHLWQRGHRRLAFLAIHAKDSRVVELGWSRHREAGFRGAMRDLKSVPRVFYPSSLAPQAGCGIHEFQEKSAREAARAVMPSLRNGSVKAVICANGLAFLGLLEEMRAASLPAAFWPAIVTFDDWVSDDHLLSVLRLPWDELGRAAAGALWDRAFGNAIQKNAAPREILVPMRLIARLSCLRQSHALNGNVAAALNGMRLETLSKQLI